MSCIRLTLGVALFVAATTGCSFQPPPSIHFATATEAQIAAVETEDEMWFEFRPGDEVPLNVGMVGVAEALGEGIVLVAKKRFFIVMRRGLPPALSFDGESVAYEGSTSFLGFNRRDGTNQVNVLTYVGEYQDMPPELRDSPR